MNEVGTQIATSFSADFDENTWTFLMPENYKVWAGDFAIVDKQVYDKMLAALKMVDDARNYFAPNLRITNEIFEKVNQAIASTESIDLTTKTTAP